MAGTGVAGKLIVQGVLTALRAASSTLTLAGNLIVEGNGVLDYGTVTSPIPANVTHRIRWTLNEARYVGGATTVPLDTDVGLWVVDQAKMLTNGPDRGAWTLLSATAARGATQITVDPRYAAGWRPGDEIVVGPSNALPPSAPPVGANLQDERRTIVAVTATGTLTLNTPLAFEHRVEDISWSDFFGDAYTERLAPPVANLTRNVIFEAVNPAHRPHTMIMDQAVVDLADAAFVAFGPAPRNIGKFTNGHFKPFGRYAVHFHLQKDASRASRVDSVVIYGGAGRGFDVHDSYGITAYDVVVYDQAHTPFEAGNQAFWLEEVLHATTGESVALTGAHDLWLDRPLALKFGVIGTQRATGIHFGAGKGAQILGAHAAESIGSLSAGMFWPVSTPCGDASTACRDDPNRGVRGFRLTAHSSTFAFGWWNNSKFADDVIDLLGWNSQQGTDFGAYTTRTELFQVRLIGNTVAQSAHHVSGYRATGFLLDGRNSGGIGIRILDHNLIAEADDDLYENGVIRGSNVALDWQCAVGDSSCGEEAHVQLARVRFEANPLLTFIWHSQPGAYWRIRAQQGLLRPTNFTLYRPDRVIANSILDGAYSARRVDNDTAGTVAPPPRIRLQQGSGCVADETVVTATTVTLCAETDAPTVEFYVGKDLIARVGAGGTAQATFNVGTFGKKRAYLYAKAIAANGRINYSRVLRVLKVSTAGTPQPTPTAIPTATSSPRPTVTPTRTSTPRPTVTPTRTSTPRPTVTPTRTSTPRPTVTPTRTSTPRPAVTPTQTPTLAPTSSPTPTPFPTRDYRSLSLPTPVHPPTPGLGGASAAAPVAPGRTPPGGTGAGRPVLFVVQVAVVGSRQDALQLSAALVRAGLSSYFVPTNGRFSVRLGAFREQENAHRIARQAIAKGFDVTVIQVPVRPRR
jgi:hypothetical protein